MDMFDFDGNGHVDCGEQFIGYRIFQDVKSGSSGSKGRRVDGWTVFIIILVGYELLKMICGCLY